MEDAVSLEYADWIVSMLPPELLLTSSAASQGPRAKKTGSASLQMHHFAPLPDYISMISEDVIPTGWKAEVWSDRECDCSIVQSYRAGEGRTPIFQCTQSLYAQVSGGTLTCWPLKTAWQSCHYCPQ